MVTLQEASAVQFPGLHKRPAPVAIPHREAPKERSALDLLHNVLDLSWGFLKETGEHDFADEFPGKQMPPPPVSLKQCSLRVVHRH